MERERTAAAGEREAESVDPDRIAALLAAVQGTTGKDRTAIATRINELLVTMRQPGNEAREADVVLAGLEKKQFHHLYGEDGRCCRREAVETLLATGFPHALKVSPEDLAHARAPNRAPDRPRAPPPAPSPTGESPVFAASLGFAAAGQLIAAVLSHSDGGAAVAAGLGAGAIGYGAWQLHRTSAQDDRFGAILVATIGAGLGALAALTSGNGWLAASTAIPLLYGLVRLQTSR